MTKNYMNKFKIFNNKMKIKNKKYKFINNTWFCKNKNTKTLLNNKRQICLMKYSRA
jgi:hypothetical protein